MTTVYLIRHSLQLREKGIMNVEESDQLINEKIILSVEGEEKAKEISEIDELQNVDVIWSSSYVRAKQTAKYIAEKNKLDINIDSRLNERKLGDLNDLKGLGKNKQHSFVEEQLLDDNLKNSLGESLIDVQKRMDSVISKIVLDNKNKRIVIVSHGAALKFYLRKFCKLNKDIKLEFNNGVLDFPSPCIIKLIINDDKVIDIKNIMIKMMKYSYIKIKQI